MKARKASMLVGACTLTAVALLGAAVGGSGAQTATSAEVAATWAWPNGNLAGTRDVSGPINASNVTHLGVAWADEIPSETPYYGAYATTPVVSGGVVYTQDLDSNVQAISLASGKVLWLKAYYSANEGPDGVNVAAGKVFGATATSAFALSAATGKQLWIKRLVGPPGEGIDMAPGYNNGTVYVATVGVNNAANAKYTGGGRGVLYAIDASTGATKWKWNIVPANLWSSAHTSLNAGGGLWEPPSFDAQGNLYVGTANPAPFPGTAKYPWGSSRPGANLYTDSIVKLDSRTGKVLWYYQLTPHDIYDWDVQNSPILSEVRGRQVVIDAGKAGIIVALDAHTGKLIWKLPVGVHNGHDHDGLLAEKGDTSALKVGEVVLPGPLGGVESPLASNGTTVFAAVNNQPGLVSASGITVVPNPFEGSGDIVAVNEATGKLEWQRKVPSSPFGAISVTNNVLFTTTFDGTLWAFNADNGKLLLHTTLPDETNAPVAIDGNTVITAASFSNATTPEIIAFRLGAHGNPLKANTTRRG